MSKLKNAHCDNIIMWFVYIKLRIVLLVYSYIYILNMFNLFGIYNHIGEYTEYLTYDCSSLISIIDQQPSSSYLTMLQSYLKPVPSTSEKSEKNLSMSTVTNATKFILKTLTPHCFVDNSPKYFLEKCPDKRQFTQYPTTQNQVTVLRSPIISSNWTFVPAPQEHIPKIKSNVHSMDDLHPHDDQPVVKMDNQQTIKDNLILVQKIANKTNINIQQNIVLNDAMIIQENIQDLCYAQQSNIMSQVLKSQSIVVNTEPPVISKDDMLIHDPPTQQNESLLPPVDIKPVYQINKIIKAKYDSSGDKNYLIKWRNFSKEHNSNEPYENLNEAAQKFVDTHTIPTIGKKPKNQ